MESVLQAIENIMTVESILAMIFGAVVGTVLGAIPGLNGTMAIALVLPITLYVSPWVGIPMILAIYKAATWGGSVGSIMINTPGTSAAIVVALDGYPLNRQGKPLRALKAALYSGIVGDILSDLVTIFICAPIATVALMIGPPEFMMLIVLALSIITILGDTAPVKAMISAGLGLFFAGIGYDPVTQTPRLMFNVIELGDGIKFVPMLVGMFALSEALYKFLKENDKPSSEKAAEVMKSKENNFTWLDMWRNKFTALMGAGIGTFIGALPGIGSTVSPWLAYAVSKKTSKNPEEYGKGSVTGLISAQSACNAVSGANLIPLLTLGIPGDTVAAMLIGTMTIHGMQPGPLIMKTNPVGVYSIFVSLLVCDVIYFAVGVLAVKYAAAITKISSRTLTTLIVVMSVIGAYAYNRSMFDVFIMFVFGVLERIPQVFFDIQPQDGQKYIQILGRKGNDRVYKYIREDYINNVINLHKYKIYLPKANGAGALGEVLSPPVLAEPGTGSTETFLSIGAFETEEEAQATLKYIKTKFARIMLGVLKTTQDITPQKWEHVPLQNFAPASDIDWTKSIPEIDQQLYKKYGLDKTEIQFIETHVREMT